MCLSQGMSCPGVDRGIDRDPKVMETQAVFFGAAKGSPGQARR